MTHEILRAHTLLLVVGGSRAYGLHTDTSDVDLKGVAMAPREIVLGFRGSFEQSDDAATMQGFADLLTAEEGAAASAHGLEGTVFELRKFLTLAAQANPNILDVLFGRDADVRLITPLGQRLRDARDHFVSAKAHQTFVGYATAQLKRIRNHRAWLLDPPAAPPQRTDFGLPEVSPVPRGQLDAAEHALQEGGLTLSDNLIEVLKRERSFRSAQRAYQQYEHWKAHRNPQRAALEAAHGYDTKHGAHLVRLLRMGVEILETGEVHVWRGEGGPGDAAELQAVRAGAWAYDDLVAYADVQTEHIAGLVARGEVVVPAEPPMETLDALCVELMHAGLHA